MTRRNQNVLISIGFAGIVGVCIAICLLVRIETYVGMTRNELGFFFVVAPVLNMILVYAVQKIAFQILNELRP